MNKNFTADFETTTDEDDCRVWAYAVCNIDDPTEFHYGTTFEEFIAFCSQPKKNFTLYMHNLKFDGSFIISWILHNGFKYISDKKDRADNTFTTLITDMGQFYAIEIYFEVKKSRVNKVKILDSLNQYKYSPLTMDQILDKFSFVEEKQENV